MIVEQKLRDIQARAKDIENKMNSGDVSGDDSMGVVVTAPRGQFVHHGRKGNWGCPICC